MSCTIRRSWWLVGAAVAALCGSSPVRADGGAETTVNAFAGGLTSSIPIGVPAFRGLEPKTSLFYNSGAGNGFVGVGWSLGGVSVIERQGPGGGTPNYDGNDTYRLDGNLLLPCAQAAGSPSCTTGGTHATRIESYARITFAGASNTWTVWQRDGRSTTFGPVLQTTQGTFRWGISRTADAKGNAVTYGWTPFDGVNESYLETISYNGTVITFFREARPDPYTYAVGGAATCYDRCPGSDVVKCNPHACPGVGLVTVSARLRSIFVYQPGVSHLRAYRLSYGQGSTGRSLLTGVQQYGNDVTHDGGGLITGGTALPAMSMEYDSSVVGVTSGPYGFNGGSLNGGRVDWPTGGFASISRGSVTDQRDGGIAFGDFNGDGRTDIAWSLWECGDWYGAGCQAHTEIWLGTGYGWTPGPAWPTAGYLSIDRSTTADQQDGGVRLVDLNGDGKTDIVWSLYKCNGWYGSGCAAYNEIWLSTGTGFVRGPAWPTGGYVAMDRDGQGNVKDGGVRFADLNGDGKMDIVWSMWECTDWYGVGCQAHNEIWLYTDTGFVAGPAWPTAGYISMDRDTTGDQRDGGVRLVDINGDGKADVVWSLYKCNGWYGPGCAGYNEIWLSTGTGFTRGPAWPTSGFIAMDNDSTGNMQDGGIRFADINGDGRMDIVWSMYKCNGWYTPGCAGYNEIWLNAGNFFVRGPAWPTSGFVVMDNTSTGTMQDGGVRLVDLNGDGKADIVWSMYKCNGWYGPGCAGYNQTFLSTGTGFMNGPALATSGYIAMDANGQGSMVDGGVRLTDLNGDGKLDVVRSIRACNGWYGAGCWSYNEARLATGGSDLMFRIKNGLGASTQIGYTPSTNWSNTYLPQGMVFPTVGWVMVSDGRGGDPQVTSYTYAGARWRDATASDPVREFLGFRKATTILGFTGPYSETYYWQRNGTIAKPEVIYKRRANGAILSFDKFRFTENTAAPYTSLATEGWSHECNGDGVVDANHNYVSGCRRVLATYAWDQYANLTTEYLYGDYDLAGDERTAVRSFAANTAAYIVGLPAYEELRAGIGTGGPLLSRTRFRYDGATSEATPPAAGLLTTKGVWDDQTGWYVESAFGYDAWGNTTSVTDALGRTTTKTFDSTYHLYAITVTDPLGYRTQKSYDTLLGLLTSSTDPDGNVSTTGYDVFGRATLTTGPTGSQTRLEYLGWGDASTQKTRQSFLQPGGTWLWEDTYFDGLGRLYKKVGQNGVAAETIFGAFGKVWKQSVPYAVDANGAPAEPVRHDVTTYDEIGREVTVTRADGMGLTRAYGDDWVSVTDAAGAVRTSWFDAAGRVVRARETIDGVAADTTFAYDLLGRRTKSVDALGNQTQVAYDSLGRALQKSDPDQGLWRYAHDAVGRVIAETDALGATTTVAYDALGRATRRTYSDGTYDSYTFDEAGRGSSKGRLTTSVSASGVTTRAWYDAGGRRTRYETVIDGVTYAISHTYDLAGQVATVTYPDGEVVTHGYGTSGAALGRLVSVGSKVTGVSYTAKGQMASITYGNGVVTSFGFDATGEHTTSIQVGGLATINYAYDVNARIVSMTSPQLGQVNWGYSYDSLGRLTQATNTAYGAYTQSFGYDAGGRMTMQTGVGAYTYGAATHPHAVTAAGTNTYAYDANGNMTAGAGRALTYNGDHKPVTITAGGVTTSFVYDAQGQRVKKTGPAGTVVYVGGLYEVRGAAVTKYYLAGAVRVAKVAGGTTTYLHQDHLGSTRLVTDASGLEVKRYSYAPFGKVIGESGNPSAGDSHRFTGQEADDETGLTFFQARYYDPALGRFIQPDSFLPNASNPQELDLYAYANNSPINYVDPSGHAPLVPALVAWVATTLAVSAATAAVIVNVAAVVIGIALSFTNNPILQSIGMVLAGMGSAGLGGPLLGLQGSMTATVCVAGAVALAQSPVSPLDPTVKKAIGWAYTAWGGISAIDNLATGADRLVPKPVESWSLVGDVAKALNGAAAAGRWAAAGMLAAKEVTYTAIAWAAAYGASYGGMGVRYGMAFLGRLFVSIGAATPGPLTVLGSTYDLAYSLRYPDGRVIDLSGGQGGETFEFYYHTGYEMGMSFGRQHIRVGDGGGFWEIGDARGGSFGPGLGWGGWVSTQKVTVIMSPAQAAAFRGALTKGAQTNGGYQGFHADSHTYISAALQYATGKSAADLHINPGLINW
ncbi:MAG TPA: toxin TcdB middle/N-terminal domain-containing protein [Polyangia bacterium]